MTALAPVPPKNLPEHLRPAVRAAMRPALAIGYLLAVTALIYLSFSHWAYDDPFITYRYARNLASGAGFVYNSGERIQSTTTPLLTLILAVFSFAWSDLPRLANLLGAFSLAAGGLFFWDLAQSWKQRWVGWTGLILYPTFPLLVSTLGSETPLYLAFCLGAIALYARKSYNLCALSAALAVLTRPDGILVPALLAVDFLLRVRGQIPWKAVGIFLLISLPWFIFAWSYFGTPFPATLAAKQSQGEMAISQRFAPGLITIVRLYARQWYFWIEAILAVLGIYWVFRKARQWGLLLAWTGLYFLAYTILGVTRYYWYYAPLIPGFIALAGLGIAAIEHFSKGTKWLRFLPVLIITCLAVGQIIHLSQARQLADPRIAAYKAAGEWFRANTPGDARLGALEIGAIGYYSERPIVDFAGLIQPAVAEQLTLESTYSDTARWAIDFYRPEYLVLQEGVFPDLESGYTHQNCQLVKQIAGQPFGYAYNLNLYRCR